MLQGDLIRIQSFYYKKSTKRQFRYCIHLDTEITITMYFKWFKHKIVDNESQVISVFEEKLSVYFVKN